MLKLPRPGRKNFFNTNWLDGKRLLFFALYGYLFFTKENRLVRSSRWRKYPGKAELYLEDIKTKKKICSKLLSKKPKAITVFPKVAHALKSTGKETIYLVSAQSTIYNLKNPDTYFYLVCE